MRALYGPNAVLPGGGQAVSEAMWNAGVYPRDAFFIVGTGALSIRHKLLDPENSIQTPYAITYTQGPGQAYSFALLLKFVEKAACIVLMNKLAGVNLGSAGIVRVSTSGTTVYDSSASTPDVTITPTEADTACATAADRNDFWVYFTR